MLERTESTRLAKRFAEKAENGLLDVKFFVRNADEAVFETVCWEFNQLYDAVDAKLDVVLENVIYRTPARS